MSYKSRISKAFEGALCLPLTSDSKYVIFSDCHRGTEKTNDNFLKNEFIYLAALKYYYAEDFAYIELGDGDELWENRSFDAIKNIHSETFRVISQYFCDDRFFAVYGNHDIVKKREWYCDKHFKDYYCKHSMCSLNLFPHICFYSGIILRDSQGQKDIYLTHGHQADMLNSTFWPLSRFLVRYLWRPLEYMGIPDPTSAATNNTQKKKSEKRLTSWAKQNNHLLITGHTHNPMIGTSESPYFNTGSCVSPGGITCIEIENKCLSLVEWALGTKEDQTVYVKKSILGDTVCIKDYLDK